MRLKRLTVRNTKLLRDVVDIDFTRDGEPRQFTVFVGPNGLCKSTLLQSIAIAAVGPEIGNQLAAGIIPSMPDRREDAAGGAAVEATFEWRSTPTSAPRDLTSVIEIPEGARVLRGHAHFDDGTITEELRDARAKGDGGHLVTGYGVGRHLPAPLLRAESRDVSLDRLQSLFEATHPLIGTNFASRLPNGLARRFALRLREVLVDGGLLPNVEDIELTGAGGAKNASRLVEAHRFRMKLPDLKVPATWLSQGYQQTITWIADLIGHAWIDAGEVEVDPKDMTGLALIDELDLSLHPKWQRELVPALRRAFPRMQFIATTHSPMILPGFEQDEILLLSQDEQGSVRVNSATEDPRTLTSGGIYAAFFDVRDTYPADVGRDLDDYTFIASDPLRTDEEDARLESLRIRLAEARIDPGFDAVDRAQEKP